jgi:hypothetical protein
MKRLFIPLLFAAWSLNTAPPVQAQVAPAKQWDKTFGGSGIDQLQHLFPTADGGYILAGYSESGISSDKSAAAKGLFDFWVIKVDAAGNKQWDKTLGGTAFDALNAVQQTSDGGYILGGTSESRISGDKSQASRGTYDYWVIKLDAAGNKTWDKTFGSSASDGLSYLQQTTDGGYILGGQSESAAGGDKTAVGSGMTDLWIIKLDGSGNKVWDKAYGGSQSDLFSSLQQTSDGGYILGGTSASPVSGDKSQPSRGQNDFWIIKVDANGGKSWDRTYGGSNMEGLRTVRQTPDGGYIVSGTTNSGISGDISQPAKGGNDLWVIKLDGSGNMQWNKTLGAAGEEWAGYIDQASNGGYIVGAYSDSNISGDKSEASKGGNDFWIIKLNATGNKVWDKTYGGNGFEQLSFIRQISGGSYIFGGTSQSGIGGDKSQASQGTSQGAVDYWVVKLAPEVLGAQEDVLSGLTVYPNPSTGILNLALDYAGNAEVKVYSVLGQCMLSEVFSSQIKETALDLTNAPKGIYTVQVITEKQTLIKKVVLE